MEIAQAICIAKHIMLATGLDVFDRGTPIHVIQKMDSNEAGRYYPGYHTVVTGPDPANTTLIHECVHALQKPVQKSLEYKSNMQEYINDPQEKEAFFVTAMFEYGIKVVKGDLERWNMGNPTGSLKDRIEDMINRKYRR